MIGDASFGCELDSFEGGEESKLLEEEEEVEKKDLQGAFP